MWNPRITHITTQKAPRNRLGQFNTKYYLFSVFSPKKNTSLEKSLCVFATHEHKHLTESYSFPGTKRSNITRTREPPEGQRNSNKNIPLKKIPGYTKLHINWWIISLLTFVTRCLSGICTSTKGKVLDQLQNKQIKHFGLL